MPPPTEARIPPTRPPRAPVAVAGILVLALTLPCYGLTASRGLDYVDHGELVAVSCTLGIAHPTGYPTLTLLGHIVTRIIGLRPVLALNLFAVLLASAAAVTLVFLYHEILEGMGAAVRDPKARASIAACAALATALTGTWWDQGHRFEAYGLHLLFMGLGVTLFLRFLRTGRGGPVMGFVAGLAFTNHLTMALLLPGLATCGLMAHGLSAATFARFARLAPWFGLGLSPYLYLPLRSLTQPRFDWGDPESAFRLFQHLTGREYQGWLYRDAGVFALQSEFFFSRLPREVGYLGLPLAAIGLVWLAFRRPRLAALAGLFFAASVGFAGGFGILEIGPYYLGAVLGLGIAMVAGLAWILDRYGWRGAVVAGVLLVASIFVSNVGGQRQHPAPVETLARDLLEPLPAGALVVSGQWDQWLAASLYLQEVEGLRRDLTVVNSNVLWRPWYLDELSRRAPWLAARVSSTLVEMRRAVISFERGGRGDDHRIDVAYRVLLQGMIEAGLRDRAVFVTREVVPDMASSTRTIPEGLVFRVVTDTAYVPQAQTPWRFDPRFARRDVYGALTCELYARSALDRAYYELSRDRVSAAAQELERARSFDPGWREEGLPPSPWGARGMLERSLSFFDALRGLDLEGLRRNLPGARLEPGPRPRGS